MKEDDLIDSFKHYVFRFCNGTIVPGSNYYVKDDDIFYKCLKIWVSLVDFEEVKSGIFTSLPKAESVIREYISGHSIEKLPFPNSIEFKKTIKFTELFRAGTLSGKFVKYDKYRYEELIFMPSEMERIYEYVLTILCSKEGISFEEMCITIREKYLVVH